MTASSLMWGFLFGCVGLGFFLYGKRQSAVMPMLCGVALMVLPYLVSSDAALVAAGIVLIALPFFVRI